MGNAGIIRELLRYVRIQEGRDRGYAVAWPDHPPAIAPSSATGKPGEPGEADPAGLSRPANRSG
jgi:hypothetical protein